MTPAPPFDVREFAMPDPRDLPHDVAVDRQGQVVITGMQTHRMYTLDPATGTMDSVAIPLARANPRAIEIDGQGRWWVVLGAPGKLGTYDPATREWAFHDIGFYAHSVAIGGDGAAWANGHFTRAPEQLARVDARTGAVTRHDLPLHPTLASRPGGPIPYDLRVAPDGRVWMSELQGNRMIGLDAATGVADTISMPVPVSGPRRFDVGPDGALWIPSYAANELVRLDPRSRRMRRFPLPIADAAPYVARVDTTRRLVWIGTGAADAVLAFDWTTERFMVFPLPSVGALVRHLAISPVDGSVWVAYGAAPGIPARIAQLRVSNAGVRADTAELFAAGVLSDARRQWRITFTPDGKTAYFGASDGFFPVTRQATIYVSHRTGDTWSSPVVASFSGTYSDIDPFITPDGRRLYFSSIRPVAGTTRGDVDIWYVDRTPTGWGAPVRLGPEINSALDELYASATSAGDLYFAVGPRAPTPDRSWDIYMAARRGRGFARRSPVTAVNTRAAFDTAAPTADWEFNPEVSPDGRTLVFTSLRPGGFGAGDLYVSHRRGTTWSPPRNLGTAVNTRADEFHPTLGRDGYLYFVRNRFTATHGDYYRIPVAAVNAMR